MLICVLVEVNLGMRTSDSTVLMTMMMMITDLKTMMGVGYDWYYEYERDGEIWSLCINVSMYQCIYVSMYVCTENVEILCVMCC
jgi:hypothetical protein